MIDLRVMNPFGVLRLLIWYEVQFDKVKFPDCFTKIVRHRFSTENSKSRLDSMKAVPQTKLVLDIGVHHKAGIDFRPVFIHQENNGTDFPLILEMREKCCQESLFSACN